MLASKVLALTHKVSGYMNRTFAFYETDHVRYRVFGRNRYQHVDMIRPKVAF